MHDEIRNTSDSRTESPVDSGTPSPVRGANQLTTEQLRLFTVRGYELLGDSYRQDIDTQFITLRHVHTGATINLVQTDDPHLRAEVCFRTLPTDSTGVFHTLEHAVISDAPSIPIGDAFEELQRSLLLTSVNALTYPDFTQYYAEGVDRHSVETMIQVFTEAVLSGAPSYETFSSEHGYLHPDESSPSGFKYTGTVFDEMKSIYSSVRTWAIQNRLKSLAPDSPYAHASGGNPLAMLDLTYEDFRQEYENTYTISNAFFGIYGNTSLESKLDLFDTMLTGLEPGGTPTRPPRVFKNAGPRQVSVAVPVETEGKRPPEKQYRYLNAFEFELPEDPQERFELAILTELISSRPHSPFALAYQAADLDNILLGGDIIEMGDACFLLFGVSNSSKADISLSKQTISAIIDGFIEFGFDSKAIEAELSAIELRSESLARSTSRNRKLLADAVRQSMFHDYTVDDLSPVERVQVIRAKLARGESVFEKFLDRYAARNNNRIEITQVPDSAVVQDWKEAIDNKVTAKVNALSVEERNDAIEFAAHMAAREAERNDFTRVSQIPKAVLQEQYRIEPYVERELFERDGSILVLHPQPEMGDDVQLNVGFDVSDFNLNELILTQYLLLLIKERGPVGFAPGAFSQSIHALSTGLESATLPLPTRATDEGLPSYNTTMSFVTGTRIQTLAPLVEMLQQGFTLPELNDAMTMRKLSARALFFTQNSANEPGSIMRLLSASLAHAMAPIGSHAIINTADAALGVLPLIASLAEIDSAQLSASLAALQEKLIERGRLRINVTAAPAACLRSAGVLTDFLQALPAGSAEPIARLPHSPTLNTLGIVSQINNNFVGQRLQLRDDFGQPQQSPGVGAVACEIMDRFLNLQIRKIGGAYGARSYFVESVGQVGMMSWRDPNIVETLEAFKAAPDFLLSSLNQDLLDRAKIAALCPLERPMRPESIGQTSFESLLTNHTHALMTQRRAGIIDATLSDILQFARRLKAGFNSGNTVRVFGNEASLERARKAGVPMTLQARFS